MYTRKIKEGLFSVGALNPSLRVFDIVMATEYGTSYNSYIIKDEKTALIETCHHKFWDIYLDNISEVTDPKKIDYIILNHTEPDHSGALKKLVKICPNAKIICSKPASMYLAAITNDPSLSYEVVKDGDTLSLGGIELKFLSAPFLHWPDTMFTYAEKLGTVFTCDFLGAHYCEPTMTDSEITYPEKYKYALKNYFDAIFGPFLPHVQKGLSILDGLDFDTVCVSHGPVLTKGQMLEYAMERYSEWSAPAEKEKTVEVFYASAYGYTAKMAQCAAKMIADALPNVKVGVYDIIENDVADLARRMNSSIGFLIGSPTLNRDAVPPVWELLSHLDVINFKGTAGVFGSYGWSGEAVPSILGRLKGARVKTAGEGCRINFCPSETELEIMKEYVSEFISALKV